MIDASKVSAIIATRGDVDMEPLLAPLPFKDVIVWDNSQREDLGIYGRFAAIAEAKNSVVYMQDDDVIFREYDALLAEYKPGRLTVNYTQPWDIPWTGCGSVFDADMPAQAFGRYLAVYPFDHYFTHRACEGIFALLCPEVKVLPIGYEELPHATAPGRVSTGGGWYDRDRPMIFERIASLQ